ncbi:MAG: type 4a pilus biogenesis protein PilO [Candidatus Omnitrophota bacterium]
MDSKKQQELTVFAMVLFLAAIFGYNGVYKYHKGQVDMLKGQIDSEQKKNELLQEMSILDAKLKNYKDRSFVSTEITPLIDKISTFTSESGIDIDTFNPQPLLRREDYIGIALSFPLSCTYHKFGKFMSLLESNKEFIRVESVKIQKPIIVNPQESVLPKFDITVSGYYSE